MPDSSHHLRHVRHAIADLRAGQTIIFQTHAQKFLVLAPEAVSQDRFDAISAKMKSTAQLLLSPARSASLGLAHHLTLLTPESLSNSRQIADPSQPDSNDIKLGMNLTSAIPAPDVLAPLLTLCMRARLLPAMLLWPIAQDKIDSLENDIITSEDLASIGQILPLTRIAEARVPLDVAENARLVAFRPADGDFEHLAIIIGTPDPSHPVLTRLHSSCITGDLLGSLRCDCGPQLHRALEKIAEHGSGVLLYIRQEGRGIGLVNKLRAYQLQDTGFDTLSANQVLGLPLDARDYGTVAAMLDDLGFNSIRLMTNNPAKIAALQTHGVNVTERVPHSLPANPHNLAYLNTKHDQAGHLL